ncbi:MAG TPA: signal recognition particle protein, partial [Desulfotomaculum sp.]|nr:signal recognition particle protein [Desulfotomaculum sp.]
TAAKLASLLRKQGKQPLLVAADVYRPAAIKQLQVLGQQINIPVFSRTDLQEPVEIARLAVEHALGSERDLLILDTAGRLHVDDKLMVELELIKAKVHPHEIILVVDAMTGQVAVNIAQAFHERLGLDGVILTKLDGDSRGGAALSIKAVTGCPIKFVGTGEKLDALETFHPDRMAERILGMGDVLTLVEKAQSAIDAEQMERLNKKVYSAEFTLEDFLEQLREIKKMGPLQQLISMIPGLGNAKMLKELGEIDEKELVYVEAVISSMTRWERRNPQEINGSRRRRIANGSGTSIQDVNRILKQFEQTRKMIRQFAEVGKSVKKGGKYLPGFIQDKRGKPLF